MTDDQMRRFPEELGKLGFVFNFITYGGHQIDGLAGEEFATALRQDGMLALARLQRKFRLLESPYRTPQTLVGGPRADAALMSLSGAPRRRRRWAWARRSSSTSSRPRSRRRCSRSGSSIWRKRTGSPAKLTRLAPPAQRRLAPPRARRPDGAARRLANVIFEPIHDRQGRSILSIRDQNTFAATSARSG